jgi:lysophospholipase L1-like esterase
MVHSTVLLSVLLAIPGLGRAEERFFLQDGQRVVFLGDSITNAGLYIQYLDAYLATRFPGQKFELINLGLPSETVSGLSEPDHPYPRPSVHERLDRVLTKTRPDVVVACYGMNDGIYYPFGEERFQRYQKGVRRLIERVKEAGVKKLVLITPPPFDARPLQAKVLPATAAKFSWMRPYEGYDEVLGRYAAWLVTLRDEGLPVIDAHTAIDRHLAAVRRADPGYRLCDDGIHLNATGQWLIAQELLRAWHAPAEVDRAEIDFKTKRAKHGQVRELSAEQDCLRFTWRTRLPMPFDPRWDRRLAEQEQIGERLNGHRLTVTGAPHARYVLFEGDRRLGEVSAEQLTAGVDLLRYPELSTNRRSAELGKLVEQRQRLLGPAWLTDVGHQRPQTPVGLPLAEAQRKAVPLTADIRRLAEPVEITLRLVPADTKRGEPPHQKESPY